MEWRSHIPCVSVPADLAREIAWAVHAHGCAWGGALMAAPPMPDDAARAAAAPARGGPASRRRRVGFDLSLCADSAGLRVGTHANGAGAAIFRDAHMLGDTIVRSGSRKCCAPLDVLLLPRTGSHEFTFVIRTDSGSGAGVGVIAEGRSTELPSCWPNSGVAELWWLRRNGGEVYSQSQLEGSHTPVELQSEIRMLVDTDAGTVHFVVDGVPHPHACAGVTRPVRPAAFFYNRSEIHVQASGEAAVTATTTATATTATATATASEPTAPPTALTAHSPTYPNPNPNPSPSPSLYGLEVDPKLTLTLSSSFGPQTLTLRGS